MIAISEWYGSLGEHSFPTVFLNLEPAEVEAMLAGDADAPAAVAVSRRLQHAMQTLPYLSFVGTDLCAPTDSPQFHAGKGLAAGRPAWVWLATSPKCQAVLREGRTRRLVVRPFRRMDKTREFRMFIRDGKLLAMSQYCLERHFARLDQRQEEIWEKGQRFAAQLLPRLPAPTVVADVYLCSDGRMLLVDLNVWGDPTSPLLLHSWDRDWSQVIGLKLIGEPIKMKGDVSVSF